jgi:NAD-reducing hydrogenase small subunit
MVLGDCACFGGINNMRNFFTDEEITSRYYATESTTPGSATPKSKELPALTKVRPVNQVVKVDCYVPGCPPTPKMILYALSELLEGRIPVLPTEIMRFD